MAAREGPADAVLWQEQVDLRDVPRATELPARAEVVVVGGGYAGLAAALEVARAGREVVVLEKGPLGAGAHARNGGMAIPELKAGPATLERQHGPLGRRMHREVNAAFDHLEALIVREQIDCDYARTGQLYLAHSPRAVAGLRALAAEHAEAGEPVHLVDRDGLVDEIGSTSFPAGVVFERTGGLHPAKLHAGLARAAAGSGAALLEGTAARAFDDLGPGAAGGRFEIVTDRGSCGQTTSC